MSVFFSYLRLVVFTTIFLSLFSIFHLANADDEIGVITQELRGGDVITGYTGIVEISDLDRAGVKGPDYCTGSMIADNVILTAAHCLTNSSTTTSSGMGNYFITYHDPEDGRIEAYRGAATWIVHKNYDPADKTFGAGYANADIGVIKIPGRFSKTNYHDYLRLYADNKSNLKNTDNEVYLTKRSLTFYGGGYHTYSGRIDDKLRKADFVLEHVKKNHIVIDNRKKVTVCKGDSGGPLIRRISHMSDSVPTVAGVASNMELGDKFEGGLCANNDWGIDDAFFSRTNWEKLRSIMGAANISCIDGTVSNITYKRCFDIPFINDVSYEGIDKNIAVAITVAIL